jgi:hypothetical protein
MLGVVAVGCASSLTLDIGYRPAEVKQTALGEIPAHRIQLGNFSNPGGSTAVIGERKAAFDTPMGSVLVTRSPGAIVRDAITTELRRAGHTIAETNPEFIVRGQVETFWVNTDVTPVYWDVVGEVRFTIEVLDQSLAKVIFTGSYRGTQVERTYLWPSEEILRRVLEDALAAAILQMSSDGSLIKTIAASF